MADLSKHVEFREFKAAADTLGVSIYKAGELLGYSQKDMNDYLDGNHIPRQSVMAVLFVAQQGATCRAEAREKEIAALADGELAKLRCERDELAAQLVELTAMASEASQALSETMALVAEKDAALTFADRRITYLQEERKRLIVKSNQLLGKVRDLRSYAKDVYAKLTSATGRPAIIRKTINND